MTKSFPLGARNPFEFGRELGPDELVDREPELAAIERVAANRGKLFFIGPRRYGKTSILNAVEQRLTARGAVVLRYDAEAYESLRLLAQALLTGAARKLTGPVAKAGNVIGKFFGRLKPDVSLDLADQKITVRLATGAGARVAELPILTEVLDGIERLAKGRKKPVLVILDEFQQVVQEGGGGGAPDPGCHSETPKRRVRLRRIQAPPAGRPFGPPGAGLLEAGRAPVSRSRPPG